MFRRIVWDEVMRDAQMVGLLLLGLCAVLLVARLLTTPREKIERDASLPLSDD